MQRGKNREGMASVEESYSSTGIIIIINNIFEVA